MSPIHLVETKDRRRFMADLLLADESETIIESYINDGSFYTIHMDDIHIGVCLFVFPGEHTVEIKNFALQKAYQGKGFGKQVIDISCSLFHRNGYKEMFVGTSNSSIENLAFYQKAGFRFHEIHHDFFLQYSEPFYENGIRGMDMVYFRRPLTP
ncbi:N-acetyltransferase [Halobacillus sp. Nhm2S1]|uniref:GNAT family N-acetyltransferase n=1 Tax=Halobacillus sp. Nhm2S1 TaxID=2866716 RepID=UPI001C732C8A|nr:GNAT family N-acetyltransferase [Halobacillus sp. Nhm2S1]MBX0358084.1 GNAT family N-acetyltransferase [Halobacillus sp. Nhm2S1]